MRVQHAALWSPAIGSSGDVIAYGHWGRPVLVFPSEAGKAVDFANNGMLEGIRPLIDEGRVKLYCVDSFDAGSWSDYSISTEHRAARHNAYESWILDQVVPWIYDDCGGPADILTTGCSLGAYHAVNIAFKHADLFPVAIGLSGNYDPTTWRSWGDVGEAAYFNNPCHYVANLHGEHLDWLRHRLSLVLVVGEGAWEVSPTGALPGTHRLAALLREKDLRHELDVWGPDTPHDWPSWRRQLSHHLPRFC
jgi:esterase/lipase superfamily enzyme